MVHGEVPERYFLIKHEGTKDTKALRLIGYALVLFRAFPPFENGSFNSSEKGGRKREEQGS